MVMQLLLTVRRRQQACAGTQPFMSGGMARRRGPHEAIQHPLSARALYTALYTVKPTLYRLYFGISLSRLACVVYSVYSYTAYTQYSVYSIQRYTPSLWWLPAHSLTDARI